MQPEIEVRFLDVNYDDLRERLKAAGAQQKHPMQFMKRVIIDYTDERLEAGADEYNSFIRVRDEGGKVTLTYKRFTNEPPYDAHEIEVEVSSYDKTIAFFEAIGLKAISEQHTRREVWELGDTEISLDEWPWLPPMVELEGPSETRLQEVASALGLDWQNIIRGNSVIAYRKMYPGMSDKESVRDIEKLTFDEMPEWLKARQ